MTCNISLKGFKSKREKDKNETRQ